MPSASLPSTSLLDLVSPPTLASSPTPVSSPTPSSLQTPVSSPISTPTHALGQNPPEIDINNPIVNKLAENIGLVTNKRSDEREPLQRLFQNQKFRQIINIVNEALPDLIHREASLTEMNQIHYAAALTVQNHILTRKPFCGNKTKQGKSTPPWKQKLTG